MIWNEKIATIDVNVSSFPETSSSSSHKVVIHSSEFPPRVLIYPTKGGHPLSTTSLKVKEEVDEIKGKFKRNPTHSVRNFSFHCQSIVLPLIIPEASLVIKAPPPLIQMVVLGFLLNKYAPLNMPQPLNSMPWDYLKLLPRYNEEFVITTQRHIELFCAFVENINVEHQDVVSILFIQYLEGEVGKSFKSFPNATINTWEEMENSFMHKWGENKYHGYILTDFNAIKNKYGEDISYFIKLFNKFYNNPLAKIKPPQATTRVVFAGAFDLELGFTLRERKSPTLD